MRITFNWGTGIAIVYTAFAVSIAGFVGFAMGRPVDLVSNDYYAQSLRQDQHMDAVNNARSLAPALSIVQSGTRAVVLSLPADHIPTARGTLTMYRPADARADRTIAMTLDAHGQQSISLAGMLEGRWILQVRWSALGREFYVEREVDVR